MSKETGPGYYTGRVAVYRRVWANNKREALDLLGDGTKPYGEGLPVSVVRVERDPESPSTPLPVAPSIDLSSKSETTQIVRGRKP